MPEMIADAVASLRLETAGYPALVQVWMRVMAASFLLGVVVAWWDRRALWIAAMAVLTALLLILTRIALPDLARDTSGAIIHLVLWPLAAFGLWRTGVAGPLVFRLWRYWVTALIGVSLVLDLRILIGWF